MIDLLIDKTDFENVRQVATHCSFDDLVPYIRERQNLDLIDLLGSAFYFDIVNNRTQPKYVELLNGVNFEDCEGNSIYHFGLKRVLIHLSYAHYLIESGYKDTSFGLVQKMHSDSIPVPMAELTNLHNRNRRIAIDYFDLTKLFICQNKDIFKLYKKECDCTDLKLIEHRASTFKIIRKKRNGSNTNNTDRRCDF